MIRFGKILDLGKRVYVPLKMQVAKVQHSARFLLLGNCSWGEGG
jgi:hypothetical protein